MTKMPGIASSFLSVWHFYNQPTINKITDWRWVGKRVVYFYMILRFKGHYDYRFCQNHPPNPPQAGGIKLMSPVPSKVLRMLLLQSNLSLG